MTTYYKQNDKAEKALLADLNTLLERSNEVYTLTHTTKDDFKEQKEWLEKEILNSRGSKLKEYENKLDKLKTSMETYSHMWVLQIKKTGKIKFANKALTIVYRAKKDGIATVDIGQTKYGANFGKAALGSVLLFGGPIGWLIGGTLGFSAFSGAVLQSDMNGRIKELFENHLEEDDVQYIR